MNDRPMYAKMTCRDCRRNFAIRVLLDNFSGMDRIDDPRDIELVPEAGQGKIVCPYCGAQPFTRE